MGTSVQPRRLVDRSKLVDCYLPRLQRVSRAKSVRGAPSVLKHTTLVSRVYEPGTCRLFPLFRSPFIAPLAGWGLLTAT